MLYFKDKNNQIYAYEDSVDKKYIKDGLTQITEIEFKSFKLFGVFDKTEEEIQTKQKELQIKQKELQIKQKRNRLLNNVVWLLDRHRNQKEFGIPTTLTDEQVIELAQYIQQLRDIPQTYTDPDKVVFPDKPSWLEE